MNVVNCFDTTVARLSGKNEELVTSKYFLTQVLKGIEY